MKILFLHGWQSVPGGVKPSYLADHCHEVINPKLPDDNFAAALATAQAEYNQHKPDVIVGSSRGGAIAMNVNSGETPLVLLCPAWKKYGSATTVKRNSIILHSRADDTVPFADSEELIRNSGLPRSALIEVGSDHRLAGPESLQAMLAACRCLVAPASFCREFPFAYHVLPLHALKAVVTQWRLLSKLDLQKNGQHFRRATSSDVDEALGLSHFVHFYLPQKLELDFAVLPILQTQLKPAKVPPFPHAVLVVPVAAWQSGNVPSAISMQLCPDPPMVPQRVVIIVEAHRERLYCSIGRDFKQ